MEEDIKLELFGRMQKLFKEKGIVPTCSEFTSMFMDAEVFTLPFKALDREMLSKLNPDVPLMPALTMARVMDSALSFRTVIKCCLLCRDMKDFASLTEFLLKANLKMNGLNIFLPKKSVWETHLYSQADLNDLLPDRMERDLEKIKLIEKGPLAYKEVFLDSFLNFSCLESTAKEAETLMNAHIGQVKWLLETWLSFRNGSQSNPESCFESIPVFRFGQADVSLITGQLKSELRNMCLANVIESCPDRLLLEIRSPVLNVPDPADVQIHNGAIQISGRLQYEFCGKGSVSSGISLKDRLALLALNGAQLKMKFLDRDMPQFFCIGLDQSETVIVSKKYFVLEEELKTGSFGKELLDFLYVFSRLDQILV